MITSTTNSERPALKRLNGGRHLLYSSKLTTDFERHSLEDGFRKISFIALRKSLRNDYE